MTTTKRFLPYRLLSTASLALLCSSAFAFNPQNVCGIGAPCRAGASVVTSADKADPFYACPSRELSDYIGTVIALTSFQAQMGMVANLSPQTGEPEWTGSTEALVSSLRSKAHVTTFDQAADECRKGRSGIRGVVLNHEDRAMSMWVQARNSKWSFWAPPSAFSPAR
jgi:hypothetical protein